MSRSPDLARAVGMAYRLLARAEVRSLPVDPMALLRRCRDTKVCTYEEAAEMLGVTEVAFVRQAGEAEAMTFRQDGRYLVVYQTGGNPARQRFTLAHELGHRVLGHTGADLAEEREADCFASHLLCPRPVIDRLARRFEPLYAEQVAAVCYVSVSCARALMPVPEGVPKRVLDEVDELFADAAEEAKPTTTPNGRHVLRLYPER